MLAGCDSEPEAAELKESDVKQNRQDFKAFKVLQKLCKKHCCWHARTCGKVFCLPQKVRHLNVTRQVNYAYIMPVDALLCFHAQLHRLHKQRSNLIIFLKTLG